MPSCPTDILLSGAKLTCERGAMTARFSVHVPVAICAMMRGIPNQAADARFQRSRFSAVLAQRYCRIGRWQAGRRFRGARQSGAARTGDALSADAALGADGAGNLS